MALDSITSLDSISPAANVTVPSTALEYNYTTGDFVHVPNGTMAKVAVDVNYAPLLSSEKWSDGQPITLADLMYQYAIFENASLSTNRLDLRRLREFRLCTGSRNHRRFSVAQLDLDDCGLDFLLSGFEFCGAQRCHVSTCPRKQVAWWEYDALAAVPGNG